MSDDREQDLLARTLRQRSDTMAGRGLDLDAVRGRALGIRRRRRVVTGMVAAAVLAVALPVGLDAVQDSRRTAPVPAAPSPTGVDSPDGPSGPVTLDAASAPRGADPSIGYLTDSVLHTPDGTTTDLERPLSGLAPHGGEGWVGYDWADGFTYFLDADGRVVDSRPGTGTAVAADGSDLAYTVRATGGRDLVLDSTDGSRSALTTTVAPGGELEPVGFVGPGRAAYTVDVGRDGVEVGITDFERRPVLVEGLLTAHGADAATGVLSGYTSIDELAPGSCSAVLDPAAGRRVWQTCDYTLGRFSPDGGYVLGEDAYLDGIGNTQAAILDATDGTLLVEYVAPDRAFTQRLVWESEATALVTVHQEGTWYLLRLRPDGTVEQALDPVEADEMSNPWDFVARP